MVMSLTSMDIANASLLDESTAAAEGMVMAFFHSSQRRKTFLVDPGVLPQTLSVLRTRAKGFGIKLAVRDVVEGLEDEALRADLSGVLVQYPDVNGSIRDFSALTESVHSAGALVVCASDLLALALLKPPGEWGADIVLGNSARFGVPAGYGGPHAAFFAVTEKLKRKMPGRLIGKSRDATGAPAYRLALQSKSDRNRNQSRYELHHQRVNSTFAGKKQRVIFVPVKFSLQIWRPCMRFITDLLVSAGLLVKSTASLRSLNRRLSLLDTFLLASLSSTP